MVAVAAHELRELARDEILERLVAAPARLLPLVEALVPHEDAHLVAEVEQTRRGAVVACAQRVRAHIAHDGELAAHRILVKRHAEWPEVGVQINAVELHALAVEDEALVRVEAELAQADAAHERIGETLAAHGDLERIELRAVHELPELGIRHLELHLEVLVGVAVHVEVVLRRRDHRSGRILQRGARRAIRLLQAAACDDALHLHLGTVGQDVLRGHVEAIILEVDVVGLHEMHRTVDAAAGIPAGLEVVRVDLHHDLVRALHQVRREVGAEAEVAVVAASARVAVREHGGVRHHALEVEEHAPLRQIGAGDRRLVRAASAPRQLARVAVERRVEGTRNRPVMRERHGDRRRALPCERPPRVERLCRACRARAGGQRRGERKNRFLL